MHRRLIIVHGWDGYPEEGWFPWLKEKCEALGFKVTVPAMPEANEPRIYNWVPKLAEVVGTADKYTYLVGHSIGCQTIARYLETLPADVKIGGAVFVAGYFKKVTGLELEEGDVEVVKEIVSHWMDSPLDLQKVKSHLNKSMAIFSDDDPFVPPENQDEFKNIFGSEIFVQHHKGHFSGPTDGVKKLPVVLKSIKKFVNQ